MKKLIFTLIAFISILQINAQAFEEGSSYVSAGYGLGSYGLAFIKAGVAESDLKFSSFGPVYLKYEYGIAEKIGIGVNFAYMHAAVSSSNTYTDFNGNNVTYKEDLKFLTWSALARLNFHFGENDNIDPYFGFGMGYRTGKWDYKSSDPDAPAHETFKSIIPFGMDLTFGCRFLFTDNFGAYTEVGIAKSVLQLGLCAKF